MHLTNSSGTMRTLIVPWPCFVICAVEPCALAQAPGLIKILASQRHGQLFMVQYALLPSASVWQCKRQSWLDVLRTYPQRIRMHLGDHDIRSFDSRSLLQQHRAGLCSQSSDGY